MDEASGYAIIVIMVITGIALAAVAIAALAGLLLVVGAAVVLAVTGTGGVTGFVVGSRNFVQVVREAHERVPW